MKDLHEILTIVQSFASASTQAQELIGDLGVECQKLAAENDRLRRQTTPEALLRRAIVAELALKRVIAEVNPHLHLAKQQVEFDRLIGMVEDDRVAVIAAMEGDRLAALADDRDVAIDELRWH